MQPHNRYASEKSERWKVLPMAGAVEGAPTAGGVEGAPTAVGGEGAPTAVGAEGAEVWRTLKVIEPFKPSGVAGGGRRRLAASIDGIDGSFPPCRHWRSVLLPGPPK